MGLIRRPWVYKNPVTKKKHEIWHTPDMVRFLENEIDDAESAEDFLAEYERVAGDLAEKNLAYHILLVRDPDVRDDLLDLFMLTPTDYHEKGGAIAPDFLFVKGGNSCLGVMEEKEDESSRHRKIVKAEKR